MLTLSLLITPLLGIFTILTNILGNTKKFVKLIGLYTTIVNLIISLFIFILFDFSTNQFQFVQEYYEVSGYNIYLGIDGLSVYFVLLTTIIMPMAILSN
jgi:NADH:ubiquinone oxidoreductase subunit 4 (subunit M)